MYILLKIISWAFQIFPRVFVLFVGRTLGSFFYYFIPLRKSIAMKNLEIAFPDWNPNKRKSLLHSSYRHYGMVLVDFFRLPKVKRKQNKTIVNIPTESIEILKQYSGGIILSGHIGNWEYIGPSLGINNIKCAGVAQIQRNSTSNHFFNELRRSENVKIIPADGGSKVMVQTILDGYFLGLISDQNAGRKGTEAQFFNSPVSMPKGAAAFHLKTNTPILVGFCILYGNYSYHLSFQELDVQGLPENSNEVIVEINRRYSKLLEEAVIEYPQQYFWFHRKWARENYKGLSRF